MYRSKGVHPLFINKGWGTVFEQKQTNVRIPEWLVAAANTSKNEYGIIVDDPTMWVDEDGYWHLLGHNGDGVSG